MRTLFIGWMVILSFLPAWCHEGEDHGDMRAGAQKAAAPVGPAKSSQFRFSAAGKNYLVKLEQRPPEAVANQPVELELELIQQLEPPDPLLGAEMTVEGAQFEVSQTAPQPEKLGPTHAEARPGTYGLHWTPHQAGTLALQFASADGLSFPLELAVQRPWKQKVALAVCVGASGLLLLACLLRRKLYAGGWLFTGVLCGISLAVGYWPVSPPVAATPGQEEATEGIEIPLDLQKQLGLKIRTAEPRLVESTLRVPGQVRVPDGASHRLHARFSARIISEVPQVGRRVEAGEQLVLLQEVQNSADRASLRSQTIDLKARELEFAIRRNDLLGKQAELETRRQVAALQRTQRGLDLSRSEQLYSLKVLPLKELQAARTALREAEQDLAGILRQQAILKQAPLPPALPPPVQLQQYALTSPIGGVISKVEAAPDEVVEPSKALFEVVDLRTVWVNARVSEADIGRVRQYGRALITTPAYPGSFPGRFINLSPTLDPETRTAQVAFAVDNREGKLLDGMSAEVELRGSSEKLLVVPNEALVTFDGQSRVFVQIAEDRFEARTVQVGRKLRQDSVIESGLEAGTKIVVSGVGTLASELARQAKKS